MTEYMCPSCKIAWDGGDPMCVGCGRNAELEKEIELGARVIERKDNEIGQLEKVIEELVCEVWCMTPEEYNGQPFGLPLTETLAEIRKINRVYSKHRGES